MKSLIDNLRLLSAGKIDDLSVAEEAADELERLYSELRERRRLELVLLGKLHKLRRSMAQLETNVHALLDDMRLTDRLQSDAAQVVTNFLQRMKNDQI